MTEVEKIRIAMMIQHILNAFSESNITSSEAIAIVKVLAKTVDEDIEMKNPKTELIVT